MKKNKSLIKINNDVDYIDMLIYIRKVGVD